MRDLLGSIADAMTAQNVGSAIKTQVDLDRYQRIIDATTPDLIIECGTYQGGSALWFAEHAGCPVITVDLKPLVPFDMWRSWADRVTPFAGSSTDPAIVAAIAEAAAAHERVMVVLDSDHSGPHVRAEIEAYAPMVSPGCYLVVEDTLVRHMPWFRYQGSPLDAVDDLLAEHRGEWLVDEALEDLSPTTQCPSGWLRRLPFVACGNGSDLSAVTAWPCIRPRGHAGDCDHSPPPPEFRSIAPLGEAVVE